MSSGGLRELLELHARAAVEHALQVVSGLVFQRGFDADESGPVDGRDERDRLFLVDFHAALFGLAVVAGAFPSQIELALDGRFDELVHGEREFHVLSGFVADGGRRVLGRVFERHDLIIASLHRRGGDRRGLRLLHGLNRPGCRFRFDRDHDRLDDFHGGYDLDGTGDDDHRRGWIARIKRVDRTARIHDAAGIIRVDRRTGVKRVDRRTRVGTSAVIGRTVSAAGRTHSAVGAGARNRSAAARTHSAVGAGARNRSAAGARTGFRRTCDAATRRTCDAATRRTCDAATRRTCDAATRRTCDAATRRTVSARGACCASSSSSAAASLCKNGRRRDQRGEYQYS